MELSIFLAKLFGIYMLILGAICVLRKNDFELSVKEFFASRGLLAITGMLNILIGLAIAIGHPIYEFSWRGLITLFGYLGIVKGVMRLSFPAQEQQISTGILEKGYWILVLVLFVFGIYLTYHGFKV